MEEIQTERLQSLLAKLKRGDERSWGELVGLSYQRLLALAARIFHTDFRRLENQHDTASILHEALSRLLRDLRNLPADHPDFDTTAYFRLAARAIRQQLIDMARYHDRRKNQIGEGQLSTPGSPWEELFRADESDPVELSMWGELHSKIQECLTSEELQIVDFHFYLGYPQAEIAELLDIHPKQVSRIWLRAQMKMADWLPL